MASQPVISFFSLSFFFFNYFVLMQTFTFEPPVNNRPKFLFSKDVVIATVLFS